ncbi:MAG TPA: DUF4190 domain-containing protein [Candidatus Limnocylindrales bacterium]|nr:DUF4190 domain-containing protein [Candidatus Limnocylindrales bacterium]
MSTNPPTPPSGPPSTQIAGQQSTPSTSVPYTPGLQSYAQSREHTNTMAVISLATGVIAFFGHIALPGIGGGTLALVAIVTGFIARGEIKRTGEQGKWMSTVGIILGIFHLALIALIFILLILGVFVFGAWAIFHK